MCPPEVEGGTTVSLADIDESMLGHLLELAVSDATADEVTPPSGSTPGWNPERIAWFRDYHRAAAAGLEGPAHEKTWAVLADGMVAGSVRLKSAGPRTGETGIWLGRAFRGRGFGRLALEHLAAIAREGGLAVLEASTTAGNAAAQSLLASLGAELFRDGDAVKARLPL